MKRTGERVSCLATLALGILLTPYLTIPAQGYGQEDQPQRPWYQRTIREDVEAARENLAALKDKAQGFRQSIGENVRDLYDKTPQEISDAIVNSVKNRAQQVNELATYVSTTYNLAKRPNNLYSIADIAPTTSQQMIITKLNGINQMLTTQQIAPISKSLLELKQKALMILENPKDRATYDRLIGIQKTS